MRTFRVGRPGYAGGTRKVPLGRTKASLEPDPRGGRGVEVSQDAIKKMMRGQVDQMHFFEEMPVLN